MAALHCAQVSKCFHHVFVEISSRGGGNALHSMRHVFYYYARQAEIPLSTVQSIIEHMTSEMTRHYMAHVSIKVQTVLGIIHSSFQLEISGS